MTEPRLTVEDLIEAVRECIIEDLGAIGDVPFGPTTSLVELINDRLPPNVPRIPTTWEEYTGQEPVRLEGVNYDGD
jgi:hypothetical protein